ncbi:hypothetical protein CAPTEDRAFT_188252 [Capitella teleta]|uniref:Uncharacterized protein n=1 Tax=Capitella teleta TaxID=283909 RepID=R7UXE8_CAPTE|nr:hypothetical protein CAPTEDRAFT_188252 [Capitella teleta]|eukprot:ELU11253.1 hypothetical protein CAPTEDRAFT_188252 [Capitella teleta]
MTFLNARSCMCISPARHGETYIESEGVQATQVEDTSSEGWGTKRYLITCSKDDKVKVLDPSFWSNEVYFCQWYRRQVGTSCMESDVLGAGRLHGGCAILTHRRMGCRMERVPTDSKRITACLPEVLLTEALSEEETSTHPDDQRPTSASPAEPPLANG